jgi:hypothetical protein
LQSKATNRIYDVVIGFMAFFGLCLLWGGVEAQIAGTTAFLFGGMVRSIDFYHYGVYLEMLTGIYYAFTK